MSMIVSFGHKDKDVSEHKPVTLIAVQPLSYHLTIKSVVVTSRIKQTGTLTSLPRAGLA